MPSIPPTEDAQMRDAPTDDDATQPIISADEERVLKLFDRLQELQLQIALVKARNAYKPTSEPDTPEAVKAAQARLLDARAGYMLRNQVVESVVSATPILHAVHGAKNANLIEQDLKDTLKARDAASIAVANQTTALHETLDKLTSVEADSLALSRKNVELAAEMLDLVQEHEARRKGVTADEDPDTAAEIRRLEGQVQASRRRWRIMKGTAGAVVVGSGVDWVGDPVLRDVVLDSE
ncbi:hypothetical protein MCOR27_002122 [Pyricularia oryzae]|uniref:Centromere protein H C-terminal domain-containing protein n=5 Tax=Pyricularia TaxID=48558 RepID=A0ABQ8NWW0_PYRGI|nr:uncharacterized protein MGG_04487 [Pyricularia oryzae 70-15]KAH8844828.1 hypothetical protein MCOR01_002092 [Pyricularia oryzae]KAI6303320.1 hypothetical protein MCOR33_001583 [Pyricularia grisea]EHA58357.1 hypothetical protein MGG_04487 [Pyricularia oryzae 70-15]KAH9429317.1 hypothetical protein MCOR02_010723 [Pyricularia oryzae]KAI6263760.1 hypothetical protein MCOR19_000093 [Pyricularia oryzae]